jgi:hypothetical protein
MTLFDQIKLLEKIREDGETHKVLRLRFAQIVSDSPISGKRETTIIGEYQSLLDDLESLYMEVIHSIADWLVAQP